MRKAMDYLLGYEVKEIIEKEDGQIEEVPLHNKEADKSSTLQPKKTVKQPVKVNVNVNENSEGKETKEIEAKVAYHYPKGNFRFPLIPDEEVTNRPVRRSTRRQASIDEPSMKKRTGTQKVVEEVKQIREPKEVKVPQPAPPKKEVRSTRPFRPTEVPSPIYGFKKRPTNTTLTSLQRNDVVEYELPSSFSFREREEMIQSEHDNDTNGVTQEDARVIDEYTPELSEEKELHDVEQEYRLFYLADEENTSDMLQEEVPYLYEEEGKVSEERQWSVEIDEKEDPSEEVIVDTDGIEPIEETHSHVPLSEEKYDDDLDAFFRRKEKGTVESTEDEKPGNNEVEVEPVKEVESQPIELPPTSHHDVDENRLKDEQQRQIEQYSSFIKEGQSVEELAHVQERDTTVMSPEQEEEPFNMSSTPVKEPPLEQKEELPNQSRRYVPYNVMMLKKDRRKLAQKEPIKKQEQQPAVVTQSSYAFPSMNLLNVPPAKMEDDNQWLDEQRKLLDLTLTNFNVRAKVVNVTQGPTVTRFEVHPEPGVKVNKITNLTDDIKLSLAARDIRIEAPIPGKNTIGIEVPNRHSKPVLLREILRTPAFNQSPSPLTVALGLDISGEPVVTDLNKMPHGLIAGATGSGKSVCINTIIVSLLYKAAPHEVKLMLIDPKMVELAPYNGIPHLVSPVITDAKAATASLKWAVEEMERRYELFAHTGVRDITKYNERVRAHNEKSGELPYLVIIIDELADLMMVSPGEVEEAICRIAQKARACGIHLLLATQRPSVDVITGLIKANVPTRVAFSVSSQVDSRTIIDTGGAEKLLGRGDMLLLENGSSKTVRVQGNFVSDEEIDRVVAHVKAQQKPAYLFSQEELLTKSQTSISQEEDELFLEACEFVLEQGGASTSSLQRHFRIGYNRAARLIDVMEEQGIISEARGSKPRDVLITEGDLHEIYTS